MALGAQRGNVVLLTMQGEMSAVMLGGFVGLLFSVSLAHAYAHLPYGLQGIDYISATAALVGLSSVS